MVGISLIVGTIEGPSIRLNIGQNFNIHNVRKYILFIFKF